LSTPLQELFAEDKREDEEKTRLERVEQERVELEANPPTQRVPRKPPKYYIHFYNHFEFISELLQRVDELEEQVNALRVLIPK